ncbi:fatty acyl-CoA hydrolase precursor, medium chain-like isoform X1 [Patiria miniata]|uniref:Carboxylic ester hydrolase n=1 Tax=Patiria miniata TaxID=46514 RepID=A0A913ZYP2_PATMI|nr:fatty acyl-CoA hydrolase precursor, medium chain-like isoform X1 [Patiria miniata]
MVVRMFLWQFFVVTLFVCGVVSVPDDRTEVRTSSGRLRGETRVLDGREYRVFRGVPYAEPPIGDRRFRAPIPKVPLEETLNVVEYGPSCPQNIADVSKYYPDYVVRIPDSAMVISEDCLTLNIFSPVRRRGEDEHRAVMVWIHGGSFETGQGSGYDASALAVRGRVVVVTINYRLNVFGFLSTNDENAPGNFGLLDQQLALQWVHENIAGFGGDPSRVTIFGQSAGGVAVMTHLTAPNSRPFFHRVIAHSGMSRGMTPSLFRRQTKMYAQRIALKAGCTDQGKPMENTFHLVTCLRSKSTQIVLRAGLEVAKEEVVPRVWSTVFDANYFQRTPSYSDPAAFEQFDIIAGVTSGDGSPLLQLLPEIIPNCDPEMTGLSKADFGTILSIFAPRWQNSIAQEAINLEYMNWTSPRMLRSHDRLLQAANFMLDYNFLMGMTLLGNLYRGARSRRMFVFDHRSAPRVRYPYLAGAPHSEELSYVFGLPFNASGIGHIFSDEERMLSDHMITYWSNIAKSGDPNVNPDVNTTSNLTYWPEYGDSETYLLIQLNDSSVGQGYRKDKVMFWSDYLPKLTTAADEYCSNQRESMEPPTSDKPGCKIFIGEGLGLKLTQQQAETLIEVFMFVIIALLVILIIVFGALMGYKFKYKDRQAAIKKNGVQTNGDLKKNAAFEVNEGFTPEFEDTKM